MINFLIQNILWEILVFLVIFSILPIRAFKKIIFLYKNNRSGIYGEIPKFYAYRFLEVYVNRELPSGRYKYNYNDIYRKSSPLAMATDREMIELNYLEEIKKANGQNIVKIKNQYSGIRRCIYKIEMYLVFIILRKISKKIYLDKNNLFK